MGKGRKSSSSKGSTNTGLSSATTAATSVSVSGHTTETSAGSTSNMGSPMTTKAGNTTTTTNRFGGQPTTSTGSTSGGSNTTTPLPSLTLHEWLFRDFHGIYWVIASILLGSCIGFILGAGWLDFSDGAWRQGIGNRLRSTATYQFMTFHGPLWDEFLDNFAEWAADMERRLEADEYAQNPSHPRVFAVLREAIVREKGGYVHPDLGFLLPAPCGAARGVGMVRTSYHSCQIKCLPGHANEKLQAQQDQLSARNQSITISDVPIYHQEEVLIRVPLKFQMTRLVALETLIPLIPEEVQRKASLHELDDAALLVLLLAHERGVGRYSRWMPYIASLPTEPSCGYSRNLRPYMFDAIAAMRDVMGVHVHGWYDELVGASRYADKIAASLNLDYGEYLKSPNGVSSLKNIQWSLCQVASRATAGSDRYGSLRLVPLVDCINHDANAGGFIELTGQEKLQNDDFLDATEEDEGTFVVRSLRHGRRKPLAKGHELLANYNVPNYSPLDWLVSLGFIPPERWHPWHKIDPVLPRVRRDGPIIDPQSPITDTG